MKPPEPNSNGHPVTSRCHSSLGEEKPRAESVFEPPAKQSGLYCYLNSNQISPEQAALRIAEERQQSQGLIAVLGRVKPCQTIAFRKDPPPSTWWSPYLKSGAKCLHYHHYDPDFGLRYTRLQTWYPITMHIGITGRDWLLDTPRLFYDARAFLPLEPLSESPKNPEWRCAR